ncbi:hypothetical protein ACHAWF_014892 [Thalassiosira exigua]
MPASSSLPFVLPQPPFPGVGTADNHVCGRRRPRGYEYVPYDVLESDWLGDPSRLRSILDRVASCGSDCGGGSSPSSATAGDRDGGKGAEDVNEEGSKGVYDKERPKEAEEDARYAPGALVWVLLSKGKPKQQSSDRLSGQETLALHRKRRDKKNKRRKQAVDNAEASGEAEGEKDHVAVNDGTAVGDDETKAGDHADGFSHLQATKGWNASRKEFFLRARVVSDEEECSQDQKQSNSKSPGERRGDRRVLVRYSKGSTYRVRARNLVPILESAIHCVHDCNSDDAENNGEGSPSPETRTAECLPPLVVIVPETSIYRRVARVHVAPGDSLLEIGCDYGITADLVRKSLEEAGDVPLKWPPEETGGDSSNGSCMNGNGDQGGEREAGDDNKALCLGIDKSKESIDTAEQRYTKCRFSLGDVLAPGGMSAVGALCETSLMGSSPSVVCVDVNGNREIEGVLECVRAVMDERWKRLPRMIVVKSRFLYWEIKDKEREATIGKGQCYGSVECTSCTTASSSDVERKYLMPNDNMEACSTDAPSKASWTDRELLFDEMTGMNKLAAPVILTYCLEMLPGILTIILVGRVRYDAALVEDQEKNGTYGSMQKLWLDAASMAIMVTNVVAMYPTIGKSFVARGKSFTLPPAKMGTYVLTALTVMSVILSVSSVIVWNTSDLLIALGQPVEVSQMTGDFIRYLLPGLPFVALYELIRKLFQSRNNATPMLRAALVCIVVNIGLGYYLVHWTDWGWMGPAVAKSAGNIASVAAALLGLVGRDKNHQCSDTQPSKRSEYMTQTYLDVSDESRNGDGNVSDDSEFLQHLWEGFVFSEALTSSAIFDFLSLGVPGMLQVLFQLVAFEVLALVCGRLPREQAIVGIGANSILMNISTLTYMMYIGVSVSGNVRIGNALSAGDAHRAEVASNLAIALAILVALLNMVFLVATRSLLEVPSPGCSRWIWILFGSRCISL